MLTPHHGDEVVPVLAARGRSAKIRFSARVATFKLLGDGDRTSLFRRADAPAEEDAFRRQYANV